MKQIVGLMIASLCVFVAGTAGAQTASMPDLAQFAVGDRWEWRQFDNRTGLAEASFLREVVGTNSGQRFVIEGKERALDYPFVAEPSAKPWRVWPLEAGKRWSTDMNFTRPDGTAGNLKVDSRVVAHESVQVPAGTFMAFRIESDGFVTIGNFHGRISDVYWYAPEARADVKHVRKVGNSNFTRELVSYPRMRGEAVAAQEPPKQ